jgi:hypothetical protein
MGDTLRTGIAGIGQSRREDAEMALRRAQMDYTIGRQQETDARAREQYAMQKPGMEFQAQQSADKQKAYAQPINLRTSFGPFGVMFAQTGMDDWIAQRYGGTWDPSTGSLVDQQGKPIQSGPIFQNEREVQALSYEAMKRLNKDGLKDAVEIYQQRLSSPEVSDQEKQELQGEIQYTQKLINDPMMLLDFKIRAARQFGDEKTASDLQSEKEALRKESSQQAKEQREFGPEGYRMNLLKREQELLGERELNLARAKSDIKIPPGQEAGAWVSQHGEKLSADDVRKRYDEYQKATIALMGSAAAPEGTQVFSFDQWAAKNGLRFVQRGANQADTSPAPGSVRGQDGNWYRQGEDGRWYRYGNQPQQQPPEDQPSVLQRAR